MAALGYAINTDCSTGLGEDMLPPLIVTFGLSVIIQNGLLQVFSADSRKLSAGAIEIGSLNDSPGARRRLHAAANLCFRGGDHRLPAVSVLSNLGRPRISGDVR